MKRPAMLAAVLWLLAQPLCAQFQPVAIPAMQFFDSDGQPLAGGRLESYAAGTSTPAPLYQDNVGTLHTNPVILDAAGRATIFFGPISYKLVLKTSSGVTVWTADNIPGAGQAVTSNAWSAITAAVNANAGTFAASGNAWDWSAAANFKVPTSAGAAPTASGLIAYDSTANKFVFGANGATRSFGLASTTACPANQWVSSPATASAVAGCSQPAFSNLSGTLAVSQLPASFSPQFLRPMCALNSCMSFTLSNVSDADTSTFAQYLVTDANPSGETISDTFARFPLSVLMSNSGDPFASRTLKADAEATFTNGMGSGCTATLRYSTNDGSSWTNFFSVSSASQTRTTFSASIARTQIAHLRVEATASCGPGMSADTMDLRVYDIWLEAAL